MFSCNVLGYSPINIPLHQFAVAKGKTPEKLVQAIIVKTNMITRLLITLTIFCCGAVFIDAISPPHCWDFNDTSEWKNNYNEIYTYSWKFTADTEYPDDTNIPSFMPYKTTVTYTWLQDQDTPPQQGEIITIQPDPVSLDVNDVLSITVFRHILEGRENDSSRPVLRFTQTDVSPAFTVDLAYSVFYDEWTTIDALPCGSEAPDYTICCQSASYPCTGYLQIDGQVLIRDELLVVDKVELNGGCGTPTAGPTLGPCDCNFQGGDTCTWETCGFVNTDVVPTSLIPYPSPNGGDFEYIIDASGELLLTAEVSSSSSFSFDYFLESSGASILTVTFIESNGRRHDIPGASPLSQTLSGWSNTGTLSCASCCSSGSACTGSIEISAEYFVGTTLYAAVDGFTAILNACPAPSPLPGFCDETFNTNTGDWSVFHITDGWLWTGFVPSPDVPPSPSGTDFIYIHDTSAALFFPSTGSSTTPYVEITPCTVLSFNYYLVGGSGDHMSVYFEHSTAGRVSIASLAPSSSSVWRNTGPLQVYSSCPAYPCTGKIVISTSDSVDTPLDAGIDDFIFSGTVYNATYCT